MGGPAANILLSTISGVAAAAGTLAKDLAEDAGELIAKNTVQLQMITKQTHFVTSSDLSRFLSTKLGKKVEVFGFDRDSDHTYVLGAGNPNPSDDDEDLTKFADSGDIDGQYLGFGPALEYANKQGWIGIGTYVISTD